MANLGGLMVSARLEHMQVHLCCSLHLGSASCPPGAPLSLWSGGDSYFLLLTGGVW